MLVFVLEGFTLVSVAKRVHLIPFRTQQLSSSAPMILGDSPGKVGRCQREAFLITKKIKNLNQS